MLHGLGGSTYSWRLVAPKLARRFRVVSIDLRGHGRSDKPFDTAYAPTAQAELIRDAIRQLGLRRVTVAGHSFGGLVALVAAVQQQAEGGGPIARIVLLNAPAYPQAFTPTVSLLRAPVLPYVALNLMPPQLPVLFALMTEAIGMGHITEQDISIYSEPFRSPEGVHALIQTARQIIPENADALTRAYPALRVPALVIWCRDDKVVPLATGRRLAATIPGSRLRILDGCDHITPEQKPGTAARLIGRFAK